ncbi:MAG: phage tail tape measure protein [Bacteroidales bacterium]|nr:phage tail tape measure protein [Bacteroidales bacterium]
MAKEVNKRVNVWINGKEVENNIKSIRSAMIHLTNQMNKMEIGSEEYIQTSKKLRDLKTIYDEHCKSLKMTNQEIENNTTSWKKNIIHWGAFSATVQGASAAVQRFVSATQEYVDAYASLDDAMSAVQKTTGMTREEVELLKNSLQSIDTRTSTEQLLKIAEIGGRMGLAKEEIRDFTEAVNKANVALGDSFQGGAEEISSILGKISLAYKETRDQNIGQSITQIGSALNEVGASANATEGNIASFVQRVGSMPEVFRPTVEQAIALGAAFEESSIDAEVASRAFGIVMMKASTNVEGFAAAMHRPAEEIEELINTNPAQFFVEFAESLNGLKGTEIGSVLKDLKLNADGVNKIIGAMSTNTERFTEILNTSNTAFTEAISLDNEYAVVNENAAAQLEKAKKAVQDAKAALGEELIPLITELTKGTASSIRVLGEVVKWMLEHKNLIKTLAAAYGLLYAAHMKEVVAKKLSTAWTKAEMAGESAGTVVTSLFALAKAKLAKNTLAAANAQKALKAAFAATPWGAIITAVLTLATAFSFFRNKTDEAAEAQQNLEEQITQQYNAEKKKVEDLQKIIENENSTRDQKLKAIKELKKLIPDYVAELDKEGKVVNNNKNAINDYLVALKNKIRYQSLEKALNETENKIVEAELKDKKARDDYFAQGWGAEVWDKTKSFLFGGWSKEDVMKNADAELQGLYDLRTEYNKKMEEMDKELKDKTGKTYRELYNSNLLSSLDGDNPPDPGSGSGDSPDKKTLTARENFQKKLQQMENRAQADMLSGWEKTKQEIINKYEDLLTEAKELYGEDSEEFRKVQQLKLDAISAAGQQYLEKNGKILEDFSQKFLSWQKEVAPEGTNEMVDAVLGTRQKWIQRTNEVSAQMAELLDLREQFVKDNVDTSSLDALINKLGDELNGMADLEAKDIQKTLEKYQAQTDDFIKAEQRSITDATLTETQRQKNAIEEKYRLEIEHIEKTIAARIAAYGEDDPEVKQLREKIQLLNQLKSQQLANVSSGQKSVWQQLAEFDWSKLSENWQSALGLMSQGLQEFAHAAFDIYGSIAQIQDNMMEAELQKTQETYDAKSAALQRQLNQGVISQKAYDAKMQKLNEEKEKKERKLKHEQFAREKTANIIQALVNGALAVTNIWSQWAGQPIVAAVLTAVAATTNALQIAAIASQPNPYYKGGYIHGRQYAVMGEQGDEWVASNKLLRDKEASAVIAALDDYQHGNRNALAGITFAAPDPKIMSQAVSGNGRTFAPSNQTTNNYYQNPNNSELLKEIRKMNDFLRDPNNRRAYISRNIQLEFDEQEEEIRSMARL